MTAVEVTTFLHSASELRPAIDRALDDYSRYGAGCPARLQEAIRHSLLAPGKRLRPLLVLFAADACGCTRERAMPAACAVEMVHTYSLIHDDLPAMDDDDLRRGLPTCHAAFGEATAILAGDALLAQAFEILARDVQPAVVAARCCAELGQAAGATALVGGQADDLDAENKELGLDELEAIHRRKTGAMFRVSLRLGGRVAEADEAVIETLDGFGRDIGLAFQIVDDLLDLQGSVESLGKRTKKDADRGKLTFPAVLGIEASRRRAADLIEQAIGAIRPLGSRGSALAGLAQYILDRHK